jgi:chromosome segregation ATPase
MTADVAQFTNALDKVYKTFSTQEVHLDRKEMKGLGERGTIQYIEKKFQQQLQRARSAFISEFRNHSVVVESEVQKIRKELTASLELKYGEQVAELKQQAEQCDKLVSKHQDQIAHLKSLAAAQEAYLTAARHRWGLEQREKLRAEIQSLREESEASRRETSDLSHQLMCRDELVAQLRGELSNLEVELKKQAGMQQEEKEAYEERLRVLKLEMKQQQDQFKEHLRSYEDRFSEYRAKTTSELQIQDILNTRRSEALASMEEERQRHIKARTKPTSRIGSREDLDESQENSKFEPAVIRDARYRVDEMGMDTSWRDYQLASLQLVAPNRKPGVPKFKVQRGKQSVGPNAPKASDHFLPAANLTPRQSNDLGASILAPPSRC